MKAHLIHQNDFESRFKAISFWNLMDADIHQEEA